VRLVCYNHNGNRDHPDASHIAGPAGHAVRGHRVLLAASCALFASEEYGDATHESEDVVVAAGYSLQAVQEAMDYLYGRLESVSAEAEDLLVQFGCTWGLVGEAQVKLELEGADFALCSGVGSKGRAPTKVKRGRKPGRQPKSAASSNCQVVLEDFLDPLIEDAAKEEPSVGLVGHTDDFGLETDLGDAFEADASGSEGDHSQPADVASTTPKKKRGRPSKQSKKMDFSDEDEDYAPNSYDSKGTSLASSENEEDLEVDDDEEFVPTKKRKRGRPRKNNRELDENSGEWYEWPEFHKLERIDGKKEENANESALPTSVSCPLPGCEAEVGPRVDHAAAHVAEAHGQARACSECGVVAPNASAVENHWKKTEHELIAKKIEQSEYDQQPVKKKSGRKGEDFNVCQVCNARFTDKSKTEKHRLECHVSAFVNLPLPRNNEEDEGESKDQMEDTDQQSTTSQDEAFKCQKGDFEGEKVHYCFIDITLYRYKLCLR